MMTDWLKFLELAGVVAALFAEGWRNMSDIWHFVFGFGVVMILLARLFQWREQEAQKREHERRVDELTHDKLQADKAARKDAAQRAQERTEEVSRLEAEHREKEAKFVEDLAIERRKIPTILSLVADRFDAKCSAWYQTPFGRYRREFREDIRQWTGVYDGEMQKDLDPPLTPPTTGATTTPPATTTK